MYSICWIYVNMKYCVNMIRVIWVAQLGELTQRNINGQSRLSNLISSNVFHLYSTLDLFSICLSHLTLIGHRIGHRPPHNPCSERPPITSVVGGHLLTPVVGGHPTTPALVAYPTTLAIGWPPTTIALGGPPQPPHWLPPHDSL